MAEAVGEVTLSNERAAALRREIGGVLRALEARLAASGDRTIRTVVSDVLTLNQEGASRLITDASRRIPASFGARFDRLNGRVLAVLAARRGGTAATYQTLIRRNLQDAAPALDRLLEAGIARGQTIDRLARAIEDLLGGRRPSIPELRIGRLGGLSSIGPDARRIARTETMNALREANAFGMAAGGVVQAARWALSGAHPEYDDCDALALADLYGLGPGFYPVGAGNWPIAPHPNCGCYQGDVLLRPVREWGTPLPDRPRPQRFEVELPEEWSDARRVAALRRLSDATRVRFREAA